jgi:hypothetical protein
MRMRIFLFLFFSTMKLLVAAQQDSSFLDTLRIAADKASVADSIAADSINALASAPVIDTGTYKKIAAHPYLPLQKPAIYMLVEYHEKESKDVLFYTLALLVFLLGFIKTAFPKYFQNLFKLFFQTSLRQKQTKEQLAQDSFASLLINLLFLLSTGLFITLVIESNQWTNLQFWLLYAYVTAVLGIIYLGKYFFISFAGWVFNNSASAASYLFLVAVVNRIMGVVLLPLNVLLAFADPTIGSVVATISFGVVTLLFIYRYLVSFGLLRTDLQLNPFHFFLYLCAVEILPMALIYKLLVENIG